MHEWIERIGGAERVSTSSPGSSPPPRSCLWNDHPDRYRSGRVHETVSLGRRTPGGRWRPALDARRLASSGRRSARTTGRSSVRTCSRTTSGCRESIRTVTSSTRTRRHGTSGSRTSTRGASAAPVRAASTALRRLDRRIGSRRQRLAVPSAFVRERVARTWGIDADVIHPLSTSTGCGPQWRRPILLEPAEQRILGRPAGDFVLGASRFVPYKRLDLAIAAGAASGRPVVIAGSGPEESRLRDSGGVLWCRCPASSSHRPTACSPASSRGPRLRLPRGRGLRHRPRSRRWLSAPRSSSPTRVVPERPCPNRPASACPITRRPRSAMRSTPLRGSRPTTADRNADLFATPRFGAR